MSAGSSAWLASADFAAVTTGRIGTLRETARKGSTALRGPGGRCAGRRALLLALLRAAPERAALLARLRTMGLTRAQGRRLLVLESLPQALLAAGGGALTGWSTIRLRADPRGLDSHTAAHVFDAFRTANERLGTTVVIVTHDQAVAGEVRRTVAIRDGRTSTEVPRRSEVDATTGHETVVAREYAMLDRAGRLQLPAEYTRALGMRDRVALELEPDHIGVWPDDSKEG